MTNKESAERKELHRKIWAIADDVRGAVDGWDFKQYILGILFYRFISENMADYFDRAEHEAGDLEFRYANLTDEEAEEDFRPGTVEEKGFFILPSQLFENVVKDASQNENLNEDLAIIFQDIEKSAIGFKSEDDIKGLFDNLDTRSNILGGTVPEKNKRLSDILNGINSINFGNFEENDIDAFGDAYEFLISKYASNAGKSGGEFFTPQTVSNLLARLVMVGKDKINKVYDPTCGSGSLLLQMKKQYEDHILEDGFFGQEINMTNYNLARMNMFLHNINYNNFDIKRGDTLLNPQHLDEKPFDAIVSNPPYSVKWVGDGDPTLINDDRFAPAGKLAPKSKADFAFIMHSLNHLSNRGRAAIVCFPGIFYRGGAEKIIRQYLVDNNFVEAVIALPDNLFFGTSIATTVLVLAKNKLENKTLFIDASKEFKKETNNNILDKINIDRIVKFFTNYQKVDYKVALVDNEVIGSEQDYNLSVSTYVEQEDTSEEIKIDELNQEIAENVSKIAYLRAKIDKKVEKQGNILEEIQNCSVEWKELGEVVDTVTSPLKLTKKEYQVTGKIPIVDQGEQFIAGYSDYEKYLKKDEYIIFGDHSEHVKYIDFAFVQGADGLKILKPKSGIKAKYIYYCFCNFYKKEGSYKRHWSKARTTLIPIPKSEEIQEKIVQTLDKMTEYATELSSELSSELTSRKKQYSFYRDKLLSFED